jgi:hypothetical protein
VVPVLSQLNPGRSFPLHLFNVHFIRSGVLNPNPVRIPLIYMHAKRCAILILLEPISVFAFGKKVKCTLVQALRL